VQNAENNADAGPSNDLQTNNTIVGHSVVVNGAIEELYVGEDCDGKYYNMNKSYDDPCEIDK